MKSERRTIAASERQQAKRLVWGMCVLLILVPAVGCVFMFVGFLLVEYSLGGGDAVRSFLLNWTRPSQLSDNPWARIVVGLVALVSFGGPIFLWHRFFVSSGYISADTNCNIERGQLPVIGGYWKPLMYGGFCAGGAVGAWLAFQQNSILGIALFGGGGLWFLKEGVQELLDWLRGSTSSISSKAPKENQTSDPPP